MDVFQRYAEFYSRANLLLTGTYPNAMRGRQRFRYTCQPWSSLPLHLEDSLDGTELSDISRGFVHVVFGPHIRNVPNEGDLEELARLYAEYGRARTEIRQRNRLMRLRYPADIEM